jgi:hypothetical protein
MPGVPDKRDSWPPAAHRNRRASPGQECRGSVSVRRIISRSRFPLAALEVGSTTRRSYAACVASAYAFGARAVSRRLGASSINGGNRRLELVRGGGEIGFHTGQMPLTVQRLAGDQRPTAGTEMARKPTHRWRPDVQPRKSGSGHHQAAGSTFTTEWRGGPLDGVMAIKGQFAGGSPMMAIPNYARTNRDPEVAAPVSADESTAARRYVGSLDKRGVARVPLTCSRASQRIRCAYSMRWRRS